MLEVLLFTLGAAVVGFLLLFFVFKAFIWLITIPIHLGIGLVKLVLGLVIGIPVAIIGFTVCAVLVPIVATVLPILLLLLAIPLVLGFMLFGFLKLVF